MKASISQPTVATVIVLGILFHDEPALAAGCSEPSFAAPRTFAAGWGPNFVAIGDFNGDGQPDLAVANSYSDNVSVLMGNGDGTFQTAVNYGAGPRPQCAVVGDFNGDNRPDLAVANIGDTYSRPPRSATVSVLLGTGDGSFQTAVN